MGRKQTEAARLLATDELTDAAIAKRVGVCRRTLYSWQKQPEFQARLAELRAELGEVASRYAVGHLARRIRWLNGRIRRMMRIIRERAKDPAMRGVPGGDTGLLVRRVKGLGSGENLRLVEEYHVDTALLKELREHEKQAAIELGQWTEKKDLTAAGQPFKVYVGIDIDKV
jgi:hypothetical protein